MPTLYNLFWAYPLPPGQLEEIPAAIDQENVVQEPDRGKPGVVLFPALMTPSLIVAGERIELLLLAKSGAEITEQDVNRQLKVEQGLSAKKPMVPADLFVGQGELKELIQIEGPTDLAATQIETQSGNFAGVVDSRAADLWKGKGFGKVWKLSLDHKMLDVLKRQGAPAVVDLNKPGKGNLVVPAETDFDNPDHVIQTAITQDGAGKGVGEDGKYGFVVGGADIDLAQVDADNPIQIYGPLFVFDTKGHRGVGHMGDIHISGRQKLLQLSPARVIEEGSDRSIPRIGTQVNSCSADAKNLFGQFGGDGQVDIVVVGGDLVDFIRNAYNPEIMGKNPTTSDLWGVLDMRDGHYEKLYHDNVDFLTFYSLLIDFYRTHGKPAFVVTGNHDCYYNPYGISPRIPMVGKANEGIPADHNLTIYEAILSFGPTYGELKEITKGSAFRKEKLAWFYTVLTPFADYCLTLSEQRLVGLAWGDSEEMISWSRPGGQGIGHLPRANLAISKGKQRHLLEKAALEKSKADGKKIILTTHFTFASYSEAITNARAAESNWGDGNDQGDVYYGGGTRQFSAADMGTFALERDWMYRQVIATDRAIDVILTGHSHRRAFYTMRRLDKPLIGNDSVKTGFHDFPTRWANGVPSRFPNPVRPGRSLGAAAEDQQVPWVVLSDSAGSIPRNNTRGEFHGWGSDSPSGTRVRIDDTGKVTGIEAVKTSVRPRFVVALDYMDIMAKPVIASFQTEEFDANEEQLGNLPNIDLRLELLEELRDAALYGITVSSVDLYHLTTGNTWTRVQLAARPSGPTYSVWRLPARHIDLFRKRISTNKTRGVFAAISFRCAHPDLSARYDFTTPWTFEIGVTAKIRREPGLDGWKPVLRPYKRYVLARDKNNREIPDLDRRAKWPGY